MGTHTNRIQKKSRGNPTWGKMSFAAKAVEPPMYERMIAQRGLVGEVVIADDPGVREWVKKHHRHNYVPEWLLTRLGLELSADLGWGL